MSTDELEGAELDMAVALAEGYKAKFKEIDGRRYCWVASSGTHEYTGTEGWFLGGYLIHQNKICLQHVPATEGRDDLPEFWSASILTTLEQPDPSDGGTMPVYADAYGPDPLTAAMRAFVKMRALYSPVSAPQPKEK